MAYLTKDELHEMGFKSLGKNVKISNKASIYEPHLIEIGDFSRIDDFCVISGRISIGRYVHITPQCLVAGGEPGIVLEDFVTLAYGVKVFAQTDDYSGETMTNSLIPKKYKNEAFMPVKIKSYSILGANVVVFPGVIIETGCSIGAQALLSKSTEEWGIYAGIPARRVKDRSRNLLKLAKKFKNETDQAF